MLEELASFFTPSNLMYLMALIDFLAVIGIFINAFTGRSNGTPSKQKRTPKKQKPRQVNARKIYTNLEEKVTPMEGEDGLNHVKDAVGQELKPNGTLEKYPIPQKGPPVVFALLVHDAKNNEKTKHEETKEKTQDKQDLKPNEIKEVP